jgi:hypothetical protein
MKKKRKGKIDENTRAIVRHITRNPNIDVEKWMDGYHKKVKEILDNLKKDQENNKKDY